MERLADDVRGVTSTEYLMLAAVVGVASIAAMAAFGKAAGATGFASGDGAGVVASSTTTSSSSGATGTKGLALKNVGGPSQGPPTPLPTIPLPSPTNDHGGQDAPNPGSTGPSTAAPGAPETGAPEAAPAAQHNAQRNGAAYDGGTSIKSLRALMHQLVTDPTHPPTYLPVQAITTLQRDFKVFAGDHDRITKGDLIRVAESSSSPTRDWRAARYLLEDAPTVLPAIDVGSGGGNVDGKISQVDLADAKRHFENLPWTFSNVAAQKAVSSLAAAKALIHQYEFVADVAYSEGGRDHHVGVKDLAALAFDESEPTAVRAAALRMLMAPQPPHPCHILCTLSHWGSDVAGGAGSALHASVHGLEAVVSFYHIHTWYPAQGLEPTLNLGLWNGYKARYQRFQHGTLFHRDQPSWQDVAQGQVGDCYLMASLEAVAAADPSLIKNGVHPIAGGYGYEVRLFQDGKPHMVRVTSKFPKAQQGRAGLLDAGSWLNATVGEYSNVIWPLVDEKAYAMLHHGYGGIGNGGWGKDALSAITGKPSQVVKGSLLNINQLADAFEHGGALVAEMVFDGKGKQLFDANKLVTGHDYMIQNVDRQAGTVTLRNPWGPGEPPVTLTLGQLQSSVDDVIINPVH